MRARAGPQGCLAADSDSVRIGPGMFCRNAKGSRRVPTRVSLGEGQRQAEVPRVAGARPRRSRQPPPPRYWLAFLLAFRPQPPRHPTPTSQPAFPACACRCWTAGAGRPGRGQSAAAAEGDRAGAASGRKALPRPRRRRPFAPTPTHPAWGAPWAGGLEHFSWCGGAQRKAARPQASRGRTRRAESSPPRLGALTSREALDGHPGSGACPALWKWRRNGPPFLI